jgi:hypothetical protein
MDADTFPVLLVYPSSSNMASTAKVAHENLAARITEIVYYSRGILKHNGLHASVQTSSGNLTQR